MTEKKCPLFSIIVTSYNYATLIRETLNSLICQTYKDYEIIVVDDGSKDNSIEVIQEYMQKSDKIRLFTHTANQNKGLIDTIKLGINMSSGKYIAFCESDDLWTPNHLEEKAKMIALHPEANIISNDVEAFGDAESVKIRKKYLEAINAKLQDGANYIDIEALRGFNVIPTFSAVTIKKEVFNELNFDAPIPAWIDFWIYRQILKNHDLYYTSSKLTRWRMHESYNDPSKLPEYCKKSGIFMEKSDELIYQDEDKYLFIVTKNIFHKSKSWKECRLFLRLFKERCHNKKLNSKIRTKFVWYRILQFWRNKHWGTYTLQQVAYDTFAPKDSKSSILLFSHEMSLTGAPRALLTLAIALKKNGCYPIIISPYKGDLMTEAQKQGITTIIEPLLELKLQQKDSQLLHFISKFGCVLFNTLDTTHFANYLRQIKTRKMAWIHEGATSFNNNPANNIRHNFAILDEIYVVGNYAKSIASQFLGTGKEMHCLLYGCEDIKDVQKSKPHEKVRILLIGTVDKRKGMHLIQKALKLTKESVLRQIELTIVGEPREKSLAESLKNSNIPCLKYIGPKTHGEVISIFKNNDILLCPSLDDPMPIVCTEAMMLKKVIIVSDHTGTASFIKDGKNGFVIPADSPQAIADAIEIAINRQKDFSKIGEEARKVYEQNFTMSVFENNIKQIFRN